MEFRHTARGFRLTEFKDSLDQSNSIQESSLATDTCIWFGSGHEDGIRGHLTMNKAGLIAGALIQYANGKLSTNKTYTDKYGSKILIKKRKDGLVEYGVKEAGRHLHGKYVYVMTVMNEDLAREVAMVLGKFSESGELS